MPLTPKQLAFVREYCVDMNGTQAAIRAGYSEKGADVAAIRLLADDRIRSAIDARLKPIDAAAEAKATITKQWVIDRCIETFKAATATDQHAAARGTLELIAKLHGHIIERRDVRKVGDWDDLSDDELASLAGHPGASIEEIARMRATAKGTKH